MKAVLFIDTSSSEQIKVSLELNGKKFEKTAERPSHAQMVLPMIEEILKNHKIKLSEISEIKVNTHPGSFTGIRVGIAVAQMLGKLLNISVNGKPAGEVQATYQESKWE